MIEVVGDIKVGSIVVALGVVGAALLVLGLLGLGAVGLDRIFTALGLVIPDLGLCGWILLVVVAALGILVILERGMRH